MRLIDQLMDILQTRTDLELYERLALKTAIRWLDKHDCDAIAEKNGNSSFTASYVVPRSPRKGDSAEGLCLRCGLKGSHLGWNECIAALRDLVAEREIEIRRLEPEKQHHWRD